MQITRFGGPEVLEVVDLSLRRGQIRGVNLHMPASRVRVDKKIGDADPGDYDGLLLPGGFINPDLLRQSAPAREFVRAFADSGKPIATLCHGPWVLASAGLVEGRTLTSWPGIRDDLVNAGGTWLDQEVVRDGNLTTSRGPQDMAAFVPGMLDAFAQASPEPATTAPRPESDRQGRRAGPARAGGRGGRRLPVRAARRGPLPRRQAAALRSRGLLVRPARPVPRDLLHPRTGGPRQSP